MTSNSPTAGSGSSTSSSAVVTGTPGSPAARQFRPHAARPRRAERLGRVERPPQAPAPARDEVAGLARTADVALELLVEDREPRERRAELLARGAARRLSAVAVRRDDLPRGLDKV